MEIGREARESKRTGAKPKKDARSMKIKVDENGSAVLQEGQPVYVQEDGQEIPVDVPSLFSKITELNGEAKNHRLKKEEIEAEHKKIRDLLGDVDEPEKWISEAKQAVETVKNFQDKDLKDAGEVEKIKKSIEESWAEKLAGKERSLKEEIDAREQIINKQKSQLRDQMIRSSFSASEFLREKTNLLPEVAYDHLGNHFQIEETKTGQLRVIARDRDGETIYSKSNPGEPAEPEEAIEILISKHPGKDRLLVNTAEGGGSRQNSSRRNGVTVFSHDEWVRTVSNTEEDAKRKELYDKKRRGEIVIEG
jgi:hypothetical protein